MSLPATTPTTRGRYMQPLWSISAGFASPFTFSAPLTTRTMTFASLPSLTITSSSVPGVFAQKASASLLSFFGAGAVPVNATVALIEPTGPAAAVVVLVPAAGDEAAAAVAAVAGVVAGVEVV